LSNEPKLPGATISASPTYKRKMSNFLIDKKLQLRYVLVVVAISVVISTVLGYLIYDQSRTASLGLDDGLKELALGEISQNLASEDAAPIYKMVFVGIGLAGILSLFLLIMTHKVAGPLFKVSMYFDRMAVGRLTAVTPLRDGDMLRDFFVTFESMHNAVRARQTADVEAMNSIATALWADNKDPQVAAAVKDFEAHIESRRKLLS
jgi:hypothetical protein